MSDVLSSLTTEQKMNLVWAAMRANDIKQIEVEFSGSGDSGQIDDIGLPYNGAGHDLTGIMASVSDYTPPTCLLTKLIEDLSEGILEKPEIPDWYNNDGGNGTILWCADEDGTNRIEVEVNQAYTEYTTSSFSYGADGEGSEE
jgi:hypothetical protein